MMRNLRSKILGGRSIGLQLHRMPVDMIRMILKTEDILLISALMGRRAETIQADLAALLHVHMGQGLMMMMMMMVC